MVVDKAAIDNVALTNRINNTFTMAARQYSGNFGWQTCVYPRSNMCIVNVPLVEAGASHQYVMNTLHGAWCRFTAQNAACWEVFQDRLFFGGQDGVVYEADAAANDGGDPITADLKTAWNYYGTKGALKQWKMVKTMVFSDGRVAPGIRMNVDYRDAVPTYIPSQGTLSNVLWDEVDWDEVNWPEDALVTNKWQSVQAVGQCAAIRIRVVADSDNTTPIVLQVNGFEVIFERGGFL
jgi:hypothetical protein